MRVRKRFEGNLQSHFATYPTLEELFPHVGGGQPGLSYLLVPAAFGSDYHGKTLGPDGLAREGGKEVVWKTPQGRQEPFYIRDCPVMILASGHVLRTKLQGDSNCPLFMDGRLPKACGLDDPRTPEASVKVPAKSSSSGSAPIAKAS